MRDRTETTDGYTLKLDGGCVSLDEAAEWITLEQKCCPFLTIRLGVSSTDTDLALSLTGPLGTKAILNAAFPLRS